MQFELFSPNLDYSNEIELDGFLACKDKVIRDMDSNPKLGFDYSDRHFFKLQYAFSKTNKYGTEIQKRIVYSYQFLRGLNNTDIGDAENESGAHFEIKASYSDNKGAYSFLQCRPWETLAGHYFLIIDRSNDFYKTDFFLNEHQFIYEVALCRKIDFTHGRKSEEFLGDVFDEFVTLESRIDSCYEERKKLSEIEPMGLERLAIIKEKHIEITLRLKKYGMDNSFYYRWRDRYLTDSIETILRDTKWKNLKL